MKYLFLLCINFVSIGSFGQSKILTWSFKHPIKQTLIQAGTHGSVQQSLIENGELPDPFYGLNEDKFTWIEDHCWEFTSQFYLSQEQLLANHFEVEFPGIDTYAAVYLNDSLLFLAENNYKPYRAQIENFLILGNNSLRVVFTPPVIYHAERYKTEKFHYPATNDVGKIPIASLCRKPQFQFGWDWALRMNTIGFLKPVVLHWYDKTRIVGKNCTTINYTDSTANIDFQLFVTVPIHENFVWKSKIFGDVTLTSSNSTTFSRSVVLQNPKLWWPRGQGEQNMYIDQWLLLDSEGKVVDSLTVHFGVRKTELIMEPDEWGTSYYVKVNGRPIFCKGGDYIPQDIFPTRVEDSDIRKMVQTMCESNFNMVRVWGGGYYPDEVFYDACDDLGIMVWQDLMFACAMYPGDSAYLANVKGEFEHQIPRISSHPCLTLFNGNNEVDVAWKNWGFQKKNSIYGEDALQVEKSYDDLFKKLAPEVISFYTNSPYIHTSPLSNWGKDEYYNSGSMHYWGVWHGKDPIEDFGKKSGRFNAEYGFQSFPEFSTLHTFAEKKDFNLESLVMKHHQKSYVGNGMMLKQATILYGKPKSFEEFIYFSQLTQSKAISIAIASHRAGMPRCMGTLYWQINDCWQAPTWSGIDYFGNWKALQYVVKKDYEDVAVVSKIEKIGEEKYFLVSDSPEQFKCAVKYTIFDLKGKKEVDSIIYLTVNQGSVEELFISHIQKFPIDKSYMVHFEWKNAAGSGQDRWFSHLSAKHKKTAAKNIKYSLESIDLVGKTANLVIENKSFISDFWIYSDVLGVVFSENFMDYLPGKHVVKIKYSADSVNLKQFQFQWR